MKNFNKKIRATSGWAIYEKWIFEHPEYEGYLWKTIYGQGESCDVLDFDETTHFSILEGSLRRFIMENGFKYVGTRAEMAIGLYYENVCMGYEGVGIFNKWNKSQLFVEKCKTDQEASMAITLKCFETIK